MNSRNTNNAPRESSDPAIPLNLAHIALIIYNLALTSLIAWGIYITKTPWPMFALIIARPQLRLYTPHVPPRIKHPHSGAAASQSQKQPVPTPEELQAFIAMQMLEKYIQELELEQDDATSSTDSPKK